MLIYGYIRLCSLLLFSHINFSFLEAQFMTKKERFARILDYFAKKMPRAETELSYRTPYELLVAVILSAQCTDKRVNMTTPEFFKVFPSPQALAAATPEQVYPLI